MTIEHRYARVLRSRARQLRRIRRMTHAQAVSWLRWACAQLAVVMSGDRRAQIATPLPALVEAMRIVRVVHTLGGSLL